MMAILTQSFLLQGLCRLFLTLIFQNVQTFAPFVAFAALPSRKQVNPMSRAFHVVRAVVLLNPNTLEYEYVVKIGHVAHLECAMMLLWPSASSSKCPVCLKHLQRNSLRVAMWSMIHEHESDSNSEEQAFLDT